MARATRRRYPTELYRGLAVRGLLAMVLITAARPAVAVGHYRVIDLGTLGYPPSVAEAINAEGRIVGYSYFTDPDYPDRTGQLYHGFVSDGTSLTDLGSFWGVLGTSMAFGINADDVIVGWSSTVWGSQHAFRSDPARGMIDLSTLPAGTYSDGLSSHAWAINSACQIAGDSDLYIGYFNRITHACIWEPSGEIKDLGTLGGYFSRAYSLNDLGQAVGQAAIPAGETHACLWQNATSIDLGTLRGGAYSTARCINNAAQVVGQSYLPPDSTGTLYYHGFLWQNGVMLDLGTLGGNSSDAFGINTQGDVVGSSGAASGVSAFLYAQGQMYNLNDLISPGSGWTLVEAHAINDSGQIVGVGNLSGASHAFLLTPADSSAPSTTVALSGPQGQENWYRGSVNASLTATDPDGSADVAGTFYSLDGSEFQESIGGVTISGDGIHTLSYYSIDRAGNRETVQNIQVKVDATLPTLSWGTPAPIANDGGWNNTSVQIPFTTSDNLSGVKQATPTSPLMFSGEGANQTETVTVTDLAGNSAFCTSPAINIDLTPPTVTYAGNTGVYTVDQTINISCSASDSLSGVASSTCQSIVGPAYSFSIGTNSFSATATDRAGNVGEGSARFLVQVTQGSLGNLTQQFVTQAGVATALVTKLDAGAINAYVNQVQAQTGKTISAEHAAILILLAQKI